MGEKKIRIVIRIYDIYNNEIIVLRWWLAFILYNSSKDSLIYPYYYVSTNLAYSITSHLPAMV